MQSFGELIKRFRKRAGLTQEELAERAQMSPRGLIYLERGVRHPQPGTARRLADAFGLDGTERTSFLSAVESEPPTAGPVASSASAIHTLSIADIRGYTHFTEQRGDEAAGPKYKVGVQPIDNMPVQPTPFIGRDAELDAAVDTLRRPDVRLLTFTGPGGTGKTRLAAEIAARTADEYADGVCFVALAAISEPTLVLPTIAQNLGVRETPDQPILSTLSVYLTTKQMLLVLDNFEQVLRAAPDVSALLAACPQLSVVVTSRFVLHVSDEHEFEVPPLEVPETGNFSTSNFAHYDALQLFVQRARMVKPGFSFTDDNARTVVDICRRLDGLPLAIELAAARIKVLPPAALLARMDNRLKLLTGGSKDRPGRQQTLRDTIVWSYDLLDGAEQTLFCRLAVFTGGCTLQAAEAVCNGERDLAIDFLDGLTSLVDKSLMRQEEAPGPGGNLEPRFTMLETIREFALERLEERGESGILRRRHAEYFRELANQSFWIMMSAARDPILEMVSYERDNIRATLQWSLDNRVPGLALPIVGHLWIWYLHMAPAEGLRWMQDLLALPEAQGRTLERAFGLVGADACAWGVGLVHRAQQYAAEAVAIARELDDDLTLAAALIGYAGATPDYSSVEAAREAREILRPMHQDMAFAFASWVPAFTLPYHGDVATVSLWLEEALAIGRRTEDDWVQAVVLMLQGFIAIAGRNLEVAHSLLTESARRYRLSPDKLNLAGVLLALGGIARLGGDSAIATEHFHEALRLSLQLNDQGNIAACLEGLAGVHLVENDPERSARLLGAAKTLRDTTGAVALPTSDALNSGISESVRAAIDSDMFARAFDEGSRMAEVEAVRYALDVLPVHVIAS